MLTMSQIKLSFAREDSTQITTHTMSQIIHFDF